MANPASTPERFSRGAPSAALRGAVLNLTPIVLAAMLVGCTTKAQTRGAAQLTPQAQAVQQPSPAPEAAAYQPPPYEEPATPSPQAAEETAPAPLAFKDEGASAAQDEARPEQFAEEAAAVSTEEQAPPQQFTDSAAAVAEEEPLAQQQFTEEAPAKGEDVVAQQQFTDEAPAKDEDVVAQQQFTDEAPAKDEDIVAQQPFTDDAAPAPEEVTAPDVYKDEVAEAPQEVAPRPETFSDEKVAQAEPAKPPPVTMLPITITVEAEPLFDFDKYSIRADSRKKLDELVEKLKGVTFGEVITVGFADPIGSAKYNQRLSERRAASVKRYLVSKGIPANKIKTEGRGKTEEYASFKSCAGLRKQKLIACLQPDRRVEVTVTAERRQ